MVVLPAAFLITVPSPEMDEMLYVLERLIMSEQPALIILLPVISPVVPLFPIWNVPAVMVVVPA